jgi:thiol-disulfide isomerase/thioredoxin
VGILGKQSTNFLDGLHLFVKRDCPTCQLIEPSIYQLAKETDQLVAVYVQDDPTIFSGLNAVRDDTALEQSHHFQVETVPTLVRIKNGQEISRAIGWHRSDWQDVTGLDSIGAELPEQQPGCGSLSVAPGVAEVLQARYGELAFDSRQISVSEWDDPIEQAYDRGWSDGLPIVPPTAERILRMLQGTQRSSSEVVGKVPPNLVDCSVEKVTINAVMAGCKPEYMPVVLAALEAALDPMFTLHGLLCTTCFSGPVIIVNGPIAKQIGMNWGINALGRGNRANATIGRALQLIVRNVGGGRPGEIDRATLGSPGKYTFCFAEDETDSTWEPLSIARGMKPGSNSVTLFQGDGIQGFSDQRSRTPE